MKKILIFYSSIIFAIIFILLFQYNQNKNLPKINNGIIDLSNWNSESENSIVLSGKWDFHWKKLISDDKDYSADALVSAPNYWNNIKIHGKSLSGDGFATYRLKVKAKQGENLYLKINNQSTAYRLIVSGKEIAHNGVVSSDPHIAAPEYLPLVTSFTAPSEEFYINFQVSNYDTWLGGFNSPIIIGSEKKILIISQLSMLPNYLLAGSIFILIFFFLIIFLTEPKGTSFLYILLCAVNLFIQIFFSYEYPIKHLLPDIKFITLLRTEIISFYWIIPLFLLYLYSIVSKKHIKFIIHISVTLAIIFSVLTLFLPINIFSMLQSCYLCLHLLYIFVAIIILIIEFKNGNEDALPPLISIFFTLLTSIMDILYAYNILRIVDIPLGPFGVLGFIISIVFILARQYIRNYKKNKELLEEIIHLNAIRNEFLVNVSKELRAPVNNIVVATEKFKSSTYKNIDPSALKAINEIHINGLNVLDLINNIMIYSRLKYGELKYNRETFSISKLIDGIVSEYSYSIGNDIVYVSLETSKGTPPVYADRYWIARVFYNIFNICLKHSKNRNNILVETKTNYKKVYINIHSSGLSLETIDIIQKYFTDGKKDLHMPDNIAFPIYVVKHIIVNNNSSISIEPTHSGYRFTFRLDISHEKLLEEDIDCISKNLAKNTTADPWFDFTAENADKSAVIIARDLPNIKGISEALSEIGFSVKDFIIAEKALEYIENRKNIDVIVVEAAMPGISGFEICRRIRKEYSRLELPIVIITSRIQTESVIQSFEAGANDCVFEPYDIVELRARIDTLCSLKQAVTNSIENEMAFLQAQIKPHFLFNVLNTIMCYCHTDPSTSTDLIEKLCIYLRYSFDFDPSKKEILLCDEIEFVRNYLDIEKARFGELIEYNFDIQDSDKIFIPSFIVQPLVENSIKHGILKKPEGGKILVSGKQKDNLYIVTIEDNGAGMSEDKLKSVLSGEVADGTGVGLKNIRKRLKHMYNTDISIESILNRGTRVTIILLI